MGDQDRTTRNARHINASPAEVFKAFMYPDAIIQWQAPEGMTANMHSFDFKIGGGYTMSLFYPESEPKGKTAIQEDRFTARYIDIVPSRRIVQLIKFDTDEPDFKGEMKMTVDFVPDGNGTEVVFFFEDIPPGIQPSDNEAGTVSTLEKLALYIEKQVAS